MKALNLVDCAQEWKGSTVSVIRKSQKDMESAPYCLWLCEWPTWSCSLGTGIPHPLCSWFCAPEHWSLPSAAVWCTRICAGHDKPHLWDWYGTDGAVKSQALKGWCCSTSPFRKFFQEKVNATRDAHPLLTGTWLQYPYTVFLEVFPASWLWFCSPNAICCVLQLTQKQIFKFCPGCTPEWTALLLLSPDTPLVWLYEHTGTAFSRQHSYQVHELFFFGGKMFFHNWGHRLLCTAVVWEYTPGLTLRHQSIF